MKLRKHAGNVAIAAVTAAVIAGGPAAAGAIVDMARNADKVDGKHAVGAGASVKARRGKLVATNAAGRLPNNIIATAPDAARLGGKSAGKYALKATLSVPGTINHRVNPVHWTRLRDVPGGFADGADDLGPRAYGLVRNNGNIASAVGVSNVVMPEETKGIYCFGLPFPPSVVLVTPDLVNSNGLRQAGAVSYASTHGDTIAAQGCPAAADDAVVTFRTRLDNEVPKGSFFVAFS